MSEVLNLPLEEMLASGGDTRSEPGADQLNKYGTSTQPVAVIPFGSCTSSSCSPRGFEAAERLRQVLRNARHQDRVNLPPVVVLTASDKDTDINDSYNLGAQSFIRKPVDHGRFTEAVQQATRYWLRLNESPSRESMRAIRMKVPR